MHDPDQTLQRLLDHPPQDVPPPSAPVFSNAVMKRVHLIACVPKRTRRFTGGYFAAAVLGISVLMPGTWLTESMDRSASLYDPLTVDTLVELFGVTIVLGVVLLVSRRSLA